MYTATKGTCALAANHTVDCWGKIRSPIPTNSTDEYDQISLGTDHACAIDGEGKVQCWYRGPNLGAHIVPLGFTAVS